jgi:hypothetical protein
VTRDSEFPTISEALADLEQRVKTLEKAFNDHQHRLSDKLARWTAPANYECRHNWQLTDTSVLSADRRTVHCPHCDEVRTAVVTVLDPAQTDGSDNG